MILTLISPSGERWSAPIADFSRLDVCQDFAATLSPDDIVRAMAAIQPLFGQPIPPKGKATLSHKANGWQALLSNPL